MMQTLDMRFIRYLNLFSKVTGVRSKNCFVYNNFLVFAVPSFSVSKAIGPEGRNVRKLVDIMQKKVKIISLPESIEDAEKFISEIIKPIQFKSLEINGDEIIISGSRQTKATIIGRNKVRLLELKKVVEEFFGKKLRVA